MTAHEVARDVERSVLRCERIEAATLADDPYRWAAIDDLFDPAVTAELVATYPSDAYRTVIGDDGEKSYRYEARALVSMGDDRPAHAEGLAPAWRVLAAELVSPRYRAAMSALTGRNLTSLPIEVIAFHYGPGAMLGAHSDLPEKLVTHVLYFNPTWDPADGGCLRILRSGDVDDIAAEIPPLAGTSSVIVRADHSYHAVTPVSPNAPKSRRSVTVTFYRPGSVSTMWPPGEVIPLHSYPPPADG